MEARRATIKDMSGILDLMEEYHKDSNLNDIPFDRPSAVQIIEAFIGSRSTNPLVAVNDKGEIRGLLFGTLEPYFFNKNRSYATDLMFIAEAGGPQLWRAFRDWAFGAGATRIIMGVSSGDPRASQLLEALGMNNTGGMYVLNTGVS